MCSSCKKNRSKIKNTKCRGLKHHLEVKKARAYLEDLYQTAVDRRSVIGHFCGIYPFTYYGCSQNGEFTRYHFYEGSDEKIIYIVLSDEETEKIVQLFKDKMKKITENYEEFVYRGSLKMNFINEKVKHRFYYENSNVVAFMSDEGEIDYPQFLDQEEQSDYD